MTTRAQRANQELGSEIGAWGGMGAGGAAGYAGAHGASRAKAGASAARQSHKFSRELSGVTGGGRLARVKDVGTALKTGGSVAAKTKSRAMFSPVAVGSIGAAAGLAGGAHAGQKAVKAHQQRKKVGKGMTMDEIAKKRTVYELNPKASEKDKKKAGAAMLGSYGAAFGGSAAYGHKAGELGAEHHMRGGSKVLRSFGHGYKTAIGTKTGKVGAGLTAAGVAGTMATSHRAKKKGVIIPKKVQKSLSNVSAFGVVH